MTENIPVEKVPPAAPKIVGGPNRSAIVKLQYPVEYDGKVWDEITVTRMSIGQLADFMASMSEKASKRFPMFDAPDEVMNALDADDDDLITEAVNLFLPQRFKTKAEPASEIGEPTAR